MPRQSILDHEQTLAHVYRRIRESAIPEENKRLLLDFDKACVAEGLSLARRVKLLGHISLLAVRQLHSPFHSATRKEIWDVVFAIESSNLATWTKRDHKFAIKKFFKFVHWGNEAVRRRGYPPVVAGISTQVKKRDQVRVQAADILTEAEVERMLSAARDSQQRALLSMMYELGARVSEIGTMRVGDVSRDRYSYLCDLNGKTGPRSVRVIRSAAALTAWLNLHPQRTDNAAPLWGRVREGSWGAFGYNGIRKQMRAAAKAAGISKRVYHHLLRHSRITHVLASGQMNEAQIKKFFGLTQDSSMLAVYSHLVSKDANDAALRMHGIVPADATQRPAPPRCGMCAKFNEPDAGFCARCGYALRENTAAEVAARIDAAGERVSRFLRQPEIERAFRAMVREEIRAALGPAPQPQVAPRAAPTPESAWSPQAA